MRSVSVPQRDMLKDLHIRAQREKRSGHYHRAIILYQLAESVVPDCAEISSRLAPLLAHEGRHFEAWRQFRRAGRSLVRQHQAEWALSIFYEATRMLPTECDAWRMCASLERRLGRPSHALEALLEGRRHFRSALHRDEAISLLDLARKIDPWDPHIVIDLSALLNQVGQTTRALGMLEELIARCSETDLSSALAARARITWSPRHVWSWLESSFGTIVPGGERALRLRFGASPD